MKRIKSYIEDKILRPVVWLKTFKNEKGQGLVEYALILVLIAVLVIIVLGSLGEKVSNVFSNINSRMP